MCEDVMMGGALKFSCVFKFVGTKRVAQCLETQTGPFCCDASGQGPVGIERTLPKSQVNENCKLYQRSPKLADSRVAISVCGYGGHVHYPQYVCRSSAHIEA
jgi:hypothetical protein